jgi:hypothetical protein
LPGTKKEGVEEPKDRHKSGRQSKLPLEIAVKIKKKLKESKQGWTITKQDFRKRTGYYFRTKRFNLNMRNYLAGHMSEDIY